MTMCGKKTHINPLEGKLKTVLKRPARSGRSDVSSDAAASVITQGETD